MYRKCNILYFTPLYYTNRIESISIVLFIAHYHSSFYFTVHHIS